jgi:hypothetical protein
MALITVSEVKTYLSIALSDTSEDAFLAMLVKSLDAEAKTYFDRLIEPQLYTGEIYCGTGNKVLVLNEYPVLSAAAVTAVYLDNSANFGQTAGAFASTTLLVAGTDYSVVLDDRSALAATAPGSGTARLWKINGVWDGRWERRFGMLGVSVKPGAGNIKVSYTAGYAAVPQDIKLGLWRVAATIRAGRKTGQMMSSEGLSEYHYSLMARDEILRLGTTDQAFSRYKRIRSRLKPLG